MEAFKRRLDNHLVGTVKEEWIQEVLTVSIDLIFTVLGKIFWVVLVATVWFRLLLTGMTFKKSER